MVWVPYWVGGIALLFPMVMVFTAADTPRAIAPLWCRAMLTLLGLAGGCAVTGLASVVLWVLSSDGSVDKMLTGAILAGTWMACTAALMRSFRISCGRGRI